MKDLVRNKWLVGGTAAAVVGGVALAILVFGGLRSKPLGASPAQAAGQTATIRYIDRPDLQEHFADAVTGLLYDGQTLRIEFSVTRFDELKANAPITGRRYPSCRVALSPAAAIDLINRMQQVATALTQAGLAKQNPPAGAKPK